MARIGFYMRVREGAEQQYIDAHAPGRVWPTILEACRRAGMRNYSLWVGGCEGRDVFGYFESDDPDKSYAALAQDPDNAPWQEHMAPLMEVRGSFEESESMRILHEVFYLP